MKTLIGANYYGREITQAYLADNSLCLAFTDNSRIEIYDGGQLCCEHRWMDTDDDPATLIGGVLLAIEEKEANKEYDEDVIFVEVRTSKGFITLVNHNEHNGYYGGFRVMINQLCASILPLRQERPNAL